MKRKKFLFGALICLSAVALTLLFSSCNSFSETEYAVVGEGLTFDNYIYDQYENSTVRITGVESMPSHLIIPEKINGMPVVEIASEAFAYSDTLLYLEFPRSSIKLGRGFCAGSGALICVNFSGGVSVIPEFAFDGCSNLALIDGLEGLTAIESQAFAGCSSLTALNFPGTLVSIGSEAFRGCTALTRIKLPDSVTFIGDSAFWGCSGLVTVDLDCSADISEYCFLDCTALTSVRIGDGVAQIKAEAFRNCRSLYSIEIGSNCKDIADYAFHACDLLTQISFKDNSGISIGAGNDALGANN